MDLCGRRQGFPLLRTGYCREFYSTRHISLKNPRVLCETARRIRVVLREYQCRQRRRRQCKPQRRHQGFKHLEEQHFVVRKRTQQKLTCNYWRRTPPAPKTMADARLTKQSPFCFLSGFGFGRAEPDRKNLVFLGRIVERCVTESEHYTNCRAVRAFVSMFSFHFSEHNECQKKNSLKLFSHTMLFEEVNPVCMKNLLYIFQIDNGKKLMHKFCRLSSLFCLSPEKSKKIYTILQKPLLTRAFFRTRTVAQKFNMLEVWSHLIWIKSLLRPPFPSFCCRKSCCIWFSKTCVHPLYAARMLTPK